VYNTFPMDTWFGFTEVAGHFAKMYAEKEQYGKITDVHGTVHDLGEYLEEFAEEFANVKESAVNSGWDGMGRWKFSTVPGDPEKPFRWIFVVQNDVGKETYIFSPYKLPWLKDYEVVQKKEKKNGNSSGPAKVASETSVTGSES
jgi:hypothetical protein